MSEPTDGSVSTAFLGRLAARTRLRRWSRTRTVLIALGVVTVALVLAWVLVGSSLLAVRTVEVSGVSGAVAEQVRRQAADAVGDPLAAVDLDDVATSVEQIPTVGDVRVSRSWPHTLRVEVTAREPAAVVSTRGGYQILDRNGVVLGTRDRAPKALPRVVVGGGAAAALADGLTVLRSVPPAVRARTTQIDVRSAQDIRLTLRKGVRVKWGSVEDAERKAAVLTALLKQKASVYDVSAPNLPTTRR